MDVVDERCGGLASHPKSVVACLLRPGPNRKTEQASRTVGTMPDALLALADGLAEPEVPPVALASTGVDWQPSWTLLDDRCELRLVQAQHLQPGPGRTPDVTDSAWSADLLRQGRLTASCVPDRPRRERRALPRARTARLQDRAAAGKRLPQPLAGATITLAAGATAVLGTAGREILAALAAGATAAAALAHLATGRRRAKRPPVARALVARPLAQSDACDEPVPQVSAALAERRRPVDAALERLETSPGVGRRTAAVIVAALGTDLARFPTAGHAAAWAGLGPGHNESAGKRRRGKPRQGNPALRTALAEAAHGAARNRACSLAAQDQRLAARRGKQQALSAVGHTSLVSAYHLLQHGGTAADVGANSCDERDRHAVARRLTRRLEARGFNVTPQEVAA